jgi:hypothetical protein
VSRSSMRRWAYAVILSIHWERTMRTRPVRRSARRRVHDLHVGKADLQEVQKLIGISAL